MMKLPQPNYLFKCAIVLCCVLTPTTANSQIVPDTTLPVNSTVNATGSTFTIDGGTNRGGNLFHSFERFNVPTGGEATFNNASTIENILTRVTGGSISNIDGILRANGTANLFLINPSGIIFGPNASLNIGGSFIGSTANSIKFADGSEFSATNPSAPPLLTVNLPIGLQYGQNPGAIRVQGTGNSLSTPDVIFSPVIGAGASSMGLRVRPEKTIALVGGDVALEGGILTAPQGRIELGSVGSGDVSLSPTDDGWTLGYAGIQNFRDIRLSQQALVDASGFGGGNIQLVGGKITLANNSVVLIQNQGLKSAGSIRVNASESLELGEVFSDVFPSALISETLAGKGADITISTQQLILEGQALVVTKTYSAFPSGDITVNASESVQIDGFSNLNPFLRSGVTATTYNSGNAGNVTISTGRLSLLNGGYISSSTFGTGSGGNVTLNAQDTVELLGFEPNIFAPSGIGAVSLSAGDAGSLTINTDRLVVRDGGRIDTFASASGNAGSVTVNASKSVEISGRGLDELQSPSAVGSSAVKPSLAIQLIYRLPPLPSGNSGDVTINTPALSVTNGGLVNVRNEGTGNAGTAWVNANFILLDNQGGITAATASGEGGDIFVQANSLLLRRNSNITATAGGTGNGGNITIDTDTLAALENSDITANAEASFGGRVMINASGIFGTQYREQLTPESDITASSSLGASFSGVVDINTLDVDPNSGLVQLPETPTDPSDQITAGCPAQEGNNFVVTGRGGLPEDPTTTLRGTTLWSDLRHHPIAPSTHLGESQNPPHSPIVEATGWVIDEQGTVTLVAQAPQSTQHQPWQKTTQCGDM